MSRFAVGPNPRDGIGPRDLSIFSRPVVQEGVACVGPGGQQVHTNPQWSPALQNHSLHFSRGNLIAGAPHRNHLVPGGRFVPDRRRAVLDPHDSLLGLCRRHSVACGVCAQIAGRSVP